MQPIVPIILNFLFICLKLIKSEPNWTYDVLEVDCTSNTPDAFSITCAADRISRGVFGITAIFSVKQDLSDETLLMCDVFYSATGHVFTRTAFNIPKMAMSKFFNTFYRDLFLESVRNCSESAPLIATDDPFSPPLTKRVMKFEKCIISNENMPSIIKPGYYRVAISFKGQVESEISALLLVETL